MQEYIKIILGVLKMKNSHVDNKQGTKRISIHLNDQKRSVTLTASELKAKSARRPWKKIAPAFKVKRIDPNSIEGEISTWLQSLNIDMTKRGIDKVLNEFWRLYGEAFGLVEED